MSDMLSFAALHTGSAEEEKNIQEQTERHKIGGILYLNAWTMYTQRNETEYCMDKI